ncbi:MAG: ethanolamine ammonia-lyase subunit EutC, partial [Opitutaceae bacterium]
MLSSPEPSLPARPDPWTSLRAHTPARIALGRAGGSRPPAARLDFLLAHARARDAVQASFDAQALAGALAAAGIAHAVAASGATDRASYLARPDLGRRLAPASRRDLEARAAAWGGRALAVLASAGLSAPAAPRPAVPPLAPLRARLTAAGWSVTPVLVVPFARVKLQDELGALLRSRLSLILLGERPGLGVPDSLGAYLTFGPGPGRTDADRNCVSNIRPEGLPPAAAAERLAGLLV